MKKLILIMILLEDFGCIRVKKTLLVIRALAGEELKPFLVCAFILFICLL